MLTSLAAFLGLEIKDRVSRLVTAAITAVAALIFLIVAGAYLMGWVRLKLLMSYDAATVDLMLFGVFFIIGAGLAITAYVMSRARRKTSAATAALAAAPLAATVARSSLPGIVKVVPLVILGGLLLGRHFANRE
jgi:hypothetical protein